MNDRIKTSLALLGIAHLVGGYLAGGCTYARTAEEPEAELEEKARKQDGVANPLGTIGLAEGGRGGGAAAARGRLMAADEASAPGAPAPVTLESESAFAGKPRPKRASILDAEASRDAPADDAKSVEIAPTRAWFPETLLFRPSVRTDNDGQAVVEFPVPDRLTTWRVLALAQAKSGAQGGAMTQFIGTLPTYVEPVTPSFLRAGDEVDLRIQVVNTTENAAADRFDVEVSGVAQATENRILRVPPRGSALERVRFKASTPGEVIVDARFGGEDRVSRTIPVQSTLPASFKIRSGTLAGPRAFEISIPDDIEASSARATITVFPGALAVVRAEISAAPGRSDVADEAYALQLAGEAKKLLENLGETPDVDALRTLRIRTSQKVIRRARAPQIELVPMLLTAASAHPDDPVLERLTTRLKTQLARSQGPDGFFQAQSGWSLQRLLVHTADAVRALASTMTGPNEQAQLEVIRLRAGGAFERNAAQIRDGYTAAAILASGARLGGIEGKLRETLLASIEDVEGGQKQLRVDEGIERGDGRHPSPIEASALAVLALASETSNQGTATASATNGKAGAKDSSQAAADLAATVLGAYKRGVGFGDGRTNMLGLRALLSAFRTPIPENIQISAFLDDQPIASTTLRGDRRKDVAVLSAATPGAGGTHRWKLEASPAVPGLGFTLSLETHRLGAASVSSASSPAATVRDKNLGLSVSAGGPLKVSKTQTITVRAIAPARASVAIECALPTGVMPSPRSLEQLVMAGVLKRFELKETGPVLYASMGSSTEFQASFSVTPKFSGRLNTGTSQLRMEGTPIAVVAPAQWTIQSASP